MIDDIIDDAAERMQKSVNSLGDAFKKIRTGRAHPSILDTVMVSYYGSDTPLNQLANVNAEEGRSLIISPWEKNIIGDRKEVNNIHNRIDEMNYDILEKDIKNNALKRVGIENNLNPSMANISMKSNLDDDFFTSKVNKDYFMPVNRLCRGKNDLEKYFK